MIVERVKTVLDEQMARIEVTPKFIAELRSFSREALKRRTAHLARGGHWQKTIRVMSEGRLDDVREAANDLVFTTDEGLPITPKILRDHLHGICGRAGIPVSGHGRYGLRVHDLRGSAAELLLTDPVKPASPSDVMRRGRWKSWSMFRYYTELAERAQSVMAERADRVAFG